MRLASSILNVLCSYPRAPSSASSAAPRKLDSFARPSNQETLRAGRSPWLVRHATERDAGRAYRSTRSVQGNGGRYQRESIRRAIPDLDVVRSRREHRCRELDRRDQFVTL